MRYFIDVAYKGTNYHGWQKQENARTVQEVLELALGKLLRCARVETLGSGRTDTGVHALQQLVHFDLSVPIPELSRFLYQLNAILPPDIAANGLWLVPDTAHARFDAISRSYQYHICTRKIPFLPNERYCFTRPVDVDKMNEAAALLLQHQDFEAFSKVKTEVNNFLCHITRAQWQQPDAHSLVFHISANRFLRGMVRAIVGTLLEVGVGRMTVKDFEQIILSRNRNNAGRSAPPEGLFLSEVVYPPEVLKM